MDDAIKKQGPGNIKSDNDTTSNKDHTTSKVANQNNKTNIL